MSKVSSADSTSINDDPLNIVVEVHSQMETGMEDKTIQWWKRMFVQELSKHDAFILICFCSDHLYNVADKPQAKAPVLS